MARRPHPPDATDDGFLSRWSRRKLDAGEDGSQGKGSPLEEQSPAAGTVGTPAADGETPVEVPQMTDADMPPLESIDDESSVSDFFSPGVSEALRKAALRKLFHLPKYNIVDGLNDYDDDFRSFGGLGDMVTADMRHREELEAEQAREGAEPTAKTVADDGTAEHAAGEGTNSGETQQAPGEEAVGGEEHDDEDVAKAFAAAATEEAGDEET